MSAAVDIRGLKRICMGCGARFYDMNKRPIICPSCGEEFTGEIKVKSRRGRATTEGQVAEETAKTEKEDELEEEDAEAEVVSLDDLESSEGGDDDAEDAPEGDLDLDGDDLDDIEVGDDEELGDLEDLEPDAEVPEEEDEKE